MEGLLEATASASLEQGVAAKPGDVAGLGTGLHHSAEAWFHSLPLPVKFWHHVRVPEVCSLLVKFYSVVFVNLCSTDQELASNWCCPSIKEVKHK